MLKRPEEAGVRLGLLSPRYCILRVLLYLAGTPLLEITLAEYTVLADKI